MAEIRVGTSGWVCKHWGKGVFYPSDGRRSVGFSQLQLTAWVKRVTEFNRHQAAAYVYFNNIP
ncbi:MAG: hypothetical protein GEU28_11280, partial [Dehalococcoidia bacterium]|nr:hypothetical protein [Dehalococcoidia bacterium]